MIRRADYTVADEMGTPEPGVYITVRDATGDLAALFNDDSTTLANPFQSGTGGAFVYNVTDDGQYTEEYRLSLSDSPRKILTITLSTSGLDGLFVNASTLEVPIGTDLVSTTGFFALDVGGAVYVYDAAVDAAYVTANPRVSFIESGGRGFRLSLEQEITPEMVGATFDGADDHSAMAALSAYRNSLGIGGYGYSTSIPKALSPFGVSYQGATPVDLVGGGILEGEGGSIFAGGGSVLTYDANTVGIRAQFAHTSGDSTYDTTITASSASGSIIRNLTLKGANSGTNAAFPGIRLKCPTVVQDVFIDGFAGSGIKANAQLATPGADPNSASAYGNAALSQIWRNTIQNCYHGVELQGADASACTVGFGTANNNRGYGYYDNTQFGCLWIGLHGAINTLGNYHTDLAQGGAHPTLLHCYSEGGGPACTFSQGTLRVGGSWNPGDTGGGYVYASGDGVRANKLGSDSSLDVVGAASIGPQTGSATDGLLTLNSTNNASVIAGYTWSGGVGTLRGTITFKIGFGITLDAVAGSSIRLSYSGTDVVHVDNTGLDLQAAPLRYSGTQVVSARDTGWTADTGTARKAANATYAAGTTLTYSAAYVQAELTATATRLAAVEAALQNATQTIKALKDAAIAHGLIGA